MEFARERLRRAASFTNLYDILRQKKNIHNTSRVGGEKF